MSLCPEPELMLSEPDLPVMTVTATGAEGTQEEAAGQEAHGLSMVWIRHCSRYRSMHGLPRI